jgi:Ni,Fe-hydrogenase I cytochrome b subunit
MLDMLKNPYLRALLAALYIVGVVLLIHAFAAFVPGEDTIFAPIVAISLLTLSVSVMAYLFFFEPLRLFLDGAQKEAATSFGKMVGAFAIVLLLAVSALFLFPGEEGSEIHAAMGAMTAKLEETEGDAFDHAFLQEMIVHHQGAVEMAQMVLAKSDRPELLKLARDIIAAQTGEIDMMRSWMAAWFGHTTSM